MESQRLQYTRCWIEMEMSTVAAILRHIANSIHVLFKH